jgi:CTP-dependent riboflavin kinase
VIASYFALSMSPFRVTLNIKIKAKESSDNKVKEETMETKEVLEMSLNLKS